MSSDAQLLDGEFLKKLEYLHILSKRVAGQFRAERRARERGSGLEFADHRAYAPGDDFRHVDWKAYQRLDKLLLRLFEEELDLPIYLFIDTSRSMLDRSNGRPTKFLYARQIAAALCYIGLANLDRVTIVTYGDRLLQELGSQRGKGQIFRVLRFLADLEAAGVTNGREAFRTFCARPRARGTIVVISDFLDPGGFEAGLDVLRFFRHDIFAVHVTSPDEESPPLRGDVSIVDAETAEMRAISVTPALLAAYTQAYEQLCLDLARYCWRYRLGYLRTLTAEPFEDVILQVFRQGRFLA